MFNLYIFKDDGFLDPNTAADDSAGSNRHIRPQFSSWVDGGGWVDVDGWYNVCRGSGDFFRLRLECLLQVKCVGGHGGASGFDLAPEIFGLVHEEAVAVCQVGEDVLFESEDFGFLALFVLVDDVVGFEVVG